jgi:hypothetical protein
MVVVASTPTPQRQWRQLPIHQLLRGLAVETSFGVGDYDHPLVWAQVSSVRQPLVFWVEHDETWASPFHLFNVLWIFTAMIRIAENYQYRSLKGIGTGA